MFSIVVNTYLAEYRPVNKQQYLNEKCIREYGSSHRWLGAIDTDEFVVLVNNSARNLTEFLKQYEAYGGLRIGWIVYGSSGHVKRPPGGVLGNYDRCSGTESTASIPRSFKPYKTIVQPRLSNFDNYIHDFGVKDAYPRVDEHLKEVDDQHTYTYDKIAIYHFQVKSRDEFERKMKRGSGNSVHRNMEYWHDVESYANNYACPILRMPNQSINSI